MKKIVYDIVYLCLGGIALYTRVSLGENSDVLKYMSIVNQLAGAVTLLMIWYEAFYKMQKEIKQQKRSLKRLNKFVWFLIIGALFYYGLIHVLYLRFDASVLNDLITIVTLTIALTDDLWVAILQTLFYKK